MTWNQVQREQENTLTWEQDLKMWQNELRMWGVNSNWNLVSRES